MIDSDRPTASPPFDPTAFARQSESMLSVRAAAKASTGADEFTRFGSMTSIPWLTVPFNDLRTLQLDHRAGFVVSLVDGASTVEMLLDVCGMPEDEALRLLTTLAAQGIIAMR